MNTGPRLLALERWCKAAPYRLYVVGAYRWLTHLATPSHSGVPLVWKKKFRIAMTNFRDRIFVVSPWLKRKVVGEEKAK
jgi:hypothetical protein